MPVQHDLPDLWRYLLAQIVVRCNGISWMKEQNRDIWHRMSTHTTTHCGARVTYPAGAHTKRLATPPPDEVQCVICQFELSHLNLVEGDGRRSQDPKPKPPTPSGPGPEYTPDPPAQRLQIPIAV